MRFGIISDIHANLEALESVLTELKGVDAYLCLGDIVGYGPNPNECVERIAALPNLSCVIGNHDQAALQEYDLEWFNAYARDAIVWTQQQLTPESKRFLRKLKPHLQVEELTLVHGSLPDPMEYITSAWEARFTFELMQTPLCMVGHTHVAEYYRLEAGRIQPEQVSLLNGGEIALEEGSRYIVNIGGVGQPRDGNPRAGFGIYDREQHRITVRRVEYPIEATQSKMEDAGLPQLLIQRLAVGR